MNTVNPDASEENTWMAATAHIYGETHILPQDSDSGYICMGTQLHVTVIYLFMEATVEGLMFKSFLVVRKKLILQVQRKNRAESIWKYSNVI